MGHREITATAVSPQPFPLIAFPRVVTPGTSGPITAERRRRRRLHETRTSRTGLASCREIVLPIPATEVRALLTPLGRRLTEQSGRSASQPVNAGRARGPGRARGATTPTSHND